MCAKFPASKMKVEKRISELSQSRQTLALSARNKSGAAAVAAARPTLGRRFSWQTGNVE
jgi:hypothetical protein